MSATVADYERVEHMNKKTLALHVAYIGTAVAVLMAAAAAVAIRKNGVVATKPVVEKRTPIDKVRVKTAERKSGLEDPNGATATTAAVGIVCGRDKATADRYEARNDALRSIAPYRMAASAECWSGRRARRLSHTPGLRSIRSRRTSARRASRKGS